MLARDAERERNARCDSAELLAKTRAFEQYDAVASARYDVSPPSECTSNHRLVDFVPPLRIMRPVVDEPLLAGEIDGRIRIETKVGEDFIFGPNVCLPRQLPQRLVERRVVCIRTPVEIIPVFHRTHENCNVD